MIIRIVRMTFLPEKTGEFLEIFRSSKDKIRAFDGCQHVELLQDVNQPNVYSTYSHWQSETHLNAYRDSELFGQVWPATKKLFSDKPQAWSLQQVEV
ncbi:putative quinol monooxygenase [Pontibacter akesuensis]|uniref:Quinol monooxygenase YgiN n=1 Tax=Pontibacter akesuensis TaxID=388950 RepID=A0A1I7KKV8_9BACT|nr:antibiotic biosynthesis monooxygenase family protein [Pontibacter akesuensis]GHA78085.1 antibiotic biosynthesis monooxygenase [Pontibacter akesuensis]SFU98065.1 Quinol monooxygenase YgiN [Pontibacter akesuensis]